MKKIIPFILLAFIACDDDGLDSDHPGCVTGDYIHDSVDKIVTIGCGTQGQYGNFALYRIDYTDLKWTPVDDCNNCK
jgi:hypothetical protein